MESPEKPLSPLIIAGQGRKRYVPVPFAICGGREVIKALAMELFAIVNRWEQEGVSSGWAEVHIDPAVDTGGPNYPPEKWA